MAITSLLALPTTSAAFSTAPAPRLAPTDGSGSPPRKIARLSEHGGSDRARTRSRPTPATEAGVRRVKLDLGDDVPEAAGVLTKSPLPSVTHALRTLLARPTGSSSGTPTSSESPPAIVLERIYTAARAVVCVAHEGPALRSAVESALDGSLRMLAQDLARADTADDDGGVKWLGVWVSSWEWYAARVNVIAALLTYLDRTFLLPAGAPSVTADAHARFSIHVLAPSALSARLRGALGAWAAWERTAHAAHPQRETVRSLAVHLAAPGLAAYDAEVHTPYLASVAAYFSAESPKWAKALADDPGGFIALLQARLDEEQARADAVLRPETAIAAVDVARRAALEGERLQWVVREGLARMLDARALEPLAHLHATAAHLPGGLPALRDAFDAHVESAARAILTDTVRDDEMIPRLVELRTFAERVVADAFSPTDGDAAAAVPEVAAEAFAYAARTALVRAFKARRLAPAQNLARHLDALLRRGQRDASDSAFRAELGAALALHRCTDDKDVFRAWYHRLLAKRLLGDRSAGVAAERWVLKELRDNYDADFDTPAKMFTDLDLSRDLMASFTASPHALAAADDGEAGPAYLNVLQASAWPFGAAGRSGALLPTRMQAQLDAYTAFYRTRHSNRKLEFDHGLGHASVLARFNKGEKELAVSLHQTLVLLLFNDADTLTFIEIKSGSTIEDAELRRTLQSLACGKKKVLRKVPPGKDVDDADRFVFNAAFWDERRRVRIAGIVVRESVEETQRTDASILSSRGYTLDAAIVRVMKARRVLPYAQLQTEVVDAVRRHFVPDVALIKKRVDELVESEYLERDENKKGVFRYVA